jgi:hypothetical protein
MARIRTYGVDALIQDGDIVLGSDSVDEFASVNFTMASVKAYATKGLNRGLYAGIADSTDITNTTSELTLIPEGVGSLSVPAGGFSIGDSFRCIIRGLLSSANNQDFRIRVRINNNIVLDSGLLTVSDLADDNFYLNLDLTVRSTGEAADISSVASFHYTKQETRNGEGFAFSDIVGIDTTIENTLDVTFGWGEANASNSIYTSTFVLNKTF